jgi:hypothetical protein
MGLPLDLALESVALEATVVWMIPGLVGARRGLVRIFCDCIWFAVSSLCADVWYGISIFGVWQSV